MIQETKMNNGQSNDNVEKIDIPNGIVHFLEKRAGFEREDHKRRYSVSELTSCLRKLYYKISNLDVDIKAEPETFERLWSTTRGDLLHEITKAYRWRELDIDYDVVLDDERVVTVRGRLDMYDWKNRSIIDLKTTKFVNWQLKNKLIPKIEHILQIQCYGTMFSTAIPIEQLCLVYADMDTMIAFKVKNRDMSHWIKERIEELENSISHGYPPNGEVSGLCQFCKYQTRCFTDGNGINYNPIATRDQKPNKVLSLITIKGGNKK